MQLAYFLHKKGGIQVDNVRIRLITEADSGELYQLIVDNRNNLEKWIEWIRDIHNEDEMHTYIQKIIYTERKEATIKIGRAHV